MSSLLSLKFDPSPNKARMTQANHRFAKNDLGVQSWGYPNSWMVYNGKSPSQMDDNGYGTPMNWKPQYQNINQPIIQPSDSGCPGRVQIFEWRHGYECQHGKFKGKTMDRR